MDTPSIPLAANGNNTVHVSRGNAQRDAQVLLLTRTGWLPASVQLNHTHVLVSLFLNITMLRLCSTDK